MGHSAHSVQHWNRESRESSVDGSNGGCFPGVEATPSGGLTAENAENAEEDRAPSAPSAVNCLFSKLSMTFVVSLWLDLGDNSEPNPEPP